MSKNIRKHYPPTTQGCSQDNPPQHDPHGKRRGKSPNLLPNELDDGQPTVS